jgi:predicted deacylase
MQQRGGVQQDAALAPAVPALAEPVAEAGILAAGTRWATPYYVVDSLAEGPTVLLVAGVHGNELAGPLAAERMRGWLLVRGRLVLVPRANQPALARHTRRAPGTPFGDLNRNFPRTEADAPRGTMAQALWRTLAAVQPDWVLDLHEGFDFNRENDKSVGSSVLCIPRGESQRQGERLVRAVNATVTAPERQFTLLRWPARGSLSRAAWEQLGIPGLLLETTRRRQALELRVAQHQLMVAELLADLSMLAG